jgi:hypothetical protein
VRQSLGATSAISERLSPGCLAHALRDEFLGSTHESAYDPNPIGDEGVGGMVDVGLDHRAVGSELPTTANLK